MPDYVLSKNCPTCGADTMPAGAARICPVCTHESATVSKLLAERDALKKELACEKSQAHHLKKAVSTVYGTTYALVKPRDGTSAERRFAVMKDGNEALANLYHTADGWRFCLVEEDDKETLVWSEARGLDTAPPAIPTSELELDRSASVYTAVIDEVAGF